MRTKLLVSGLALALALTPAAMAQSQKPPKPGGAAAITLDATPTTVVFSGVATLSGRLSGAGNDGGVAVRLEQDASRPYGDSYASSGLTSMTANNGRYSFAVKPLLNTQYRVVAQASPPVASPGKLVVVRMLVSVRLSDSTPRRGSLVRFSGSVSPAHDGRTVSIQKRSSTGRFATVSRTALRDAGDAKSTYSRRVRVSRDGVYRVKVAGDSDHVNGYSRLRAVAVHG